MKASELDNNQPLPKFIAFDEDSSPLRIVERTEVIEENIVRIVDITNDAKEIMSETTSSQFY